MTRIERVDSYATPNEAWAAVNLYEKITAGVDNFKSAKFNVRKIMLGKQPWYEVTVEIEHGNDDESPT